MICILLASQGSIKHIINRYSHEASIIFGGTNETVTITGGQIILVEEPIDA
jgi:hypothetical protein